MESQSILSIHNEIVRNFQDQKKQLPVIEQSIQEIKKMLSKDAITEWFYKKCQTELEKLETMYNKITTNEDHNFYILQTTPIIQSYKKELNKPVRFDFISGEKIVEEESVKRMKKLENKYKQIAKQFYSNMNQSKNQETKVQCLICHETLENTNVCENCGAETDFLQLSFSYKDTERINIISKYTYERKIHFRDCLNRFQGKQNSTISPKVYETLIEQFKKHGLVNEEGKTKEEKFKNITKRHINMFLKETGYSKHYEDVNLIFHNITGGKLDDVSHLEEQLLHDFDVLSDLYDKMYLKDNKIDRKSFINSQYVLFQLLKRHKYPCDKKDFNFLKTIERQYFHDQICSELFKELKWNFQAVF